MTITIRFILTEYVDRMMIREVEGIIGHKIMADVWNRL
jgi:hypothetical protein